MIVAEFEAAAFDGFAEIFLCFFVMLLLSIKHSKFMHRLETIGMVGAQFALSTF